MFLKLYIPVFALLAFGYPLTTVASLIAGLPLGAVNQVLKTAYAGIFLVSIVASIWRRRIYVSQTLVPILLFLGLYGIRLIYDIIFRGIYAPLSSPLYVLSYFYLLTLLPAFAIALAYDRTDLIALNKWIHAVLFMSCLSILIYFLRSGNEFIMAMSSQRLEMRTDGDSTARLNPITIGACGAALSLYSIGSFCISGRAKRSYVVNGAGLLVGLCALLLSGSRGPLLTLLVGTAFLLITVAHTGKRSRVYKSLYKRIYFVISMIFVAAIYMGQQNTIMFLALSRLLETTSGADGNAFSEVRFDIAADALKSFADSPIIGNSYLTLSGSAYAHNSLLEAFMATGILGGTFFIASLVLFFGGVIKAMRMALDPESYPLALVSVAMITLSLVSMSISQSPEIWLMVVLMIAIAARSKIVDARHTVPSRHLAICAQPRSFKKMKDASDDKLAI